ncbi:potassium transporter TrkA [Rhodoblastus sphagnicola]|uniref:Potassium transporter TrkA n=1 Tax=Rhodoblastus sphagnicola TaxID=333368 RepID=A0A2S6N3X1_9HYPH|nr:potassium transporter TrkA [Rhodoblastus sphagnicola]
MTNTVEIYSDLLVVLGTAGIVVPALRRWDVSPILSYLAAGAVLGPLGLGSQIANFPFLYWFTVVNPDSVKELGELGVVFLLFLIGLELSIKRLVTMRRLVFGLGGLQVLLTGLLLSGVAIAAGAEPASAAIIGLSLSLSSTAIVIELLASQGRLTTTAGRLSFSVLLAQDLAAIAIIVFISILGSGGGDSLLVSIGVALFKAAIAIGAIVLFGRFLLRPMFHLVATAGSTELFIAAALFVIIGAGLLAHQAGLSMALGAFVIALMLAETAYGKAIEAAINPFKGLLLGVFFFTVGMKIDFREFVREPVWLISVVVGLIAIKTLILAGLARAFRVPWRAALETGMLLGPGGEFAFVSIGLASELHLLPGPIASLTLAATAVTMALTPLLSSAAKRLLPKPPGPAAKDQNLTLQSSAGDRHAIVVGHGRVGKVVTSLLTQHGVKFVAIDQDAAGVARDRRAGRLVFFGDASDPKVLDVIGLRQATGIIITINARKTIDRIVEHIRAARPEVLIVSRARDEDHARRLYAVGVTDAVPETIEASLQLSEAALVGLGVPTGLTIASIHQKRDEFRHALQQAATQAGCDEIHAIKAKTTIHS